MATRWAAAVVLALCLVACGQDGPGPTSPTEQCRRAYDAGEGNARTSPRDAWIAECADELKATP
jgi:hypothetical protein